MMRDIFAAESGAALQAYSLLVEELMKREKTHGIVALLNVCHDELKLYDA